MEKTPTADMMPFEPSGPFLVLLCGDGRVLLSHPGPEAFGGEAPQSVLDLAQAFRPRATDGPQGSLLDWIQESQLGGIPVDWVGPEQHRLPGTLTIHRWRELPGGPRILLMWNPTPVMAQDASGAPQRMTQRVLGLLDRARSCAWELQSESTHPHPQLVHLLLLVERAHGLLGSLTHEEAALDPSDLAAASNWLS